MNVHLGQFAKLNCNPAVCLPRVPRTGTTCILGEMLAVTFDVCCGFFLSMKVWFNTAVTRLEEK